MQAFISLQPNSLSLRFLSKGPSQRHQCARTTIFASASTSSSSNQRSVISSLEKVSYDVGGVRVIDDVSLQLHDGEIVCILGPSGSGKSTLLRILTGLTKPSSGSALYRGQRFKGPNPGASIVFQNFALFPWLTVLENVELGLPYASGPARDVRRSRALNAIDIIGLDGYENAYPRELSGGMRQRVGFARALAVEPELLCMDEPFSALDVLTAENLRTELLRLWQAGDVPTTSVLMITHSIEEAVALADRIIVLGRDPGHVRTVLPVSMAHPRNRKSNTFQAFTDLVYTILSERDYTLSQEDIHLLEKNHGISDPSENSTNSTATKDTGANPGTPLSTSAVSSTESISLESISLSDPIRPVDTDVSADGVGSTADETVQIRRYPQLPAVRIGSVSGLLSFIAEEPVDLYVLGQRLQLDVDSLYPLIDAAETLGLIHVDDGNVRINNRGLQFEQSTIDERKAMVRDVCLSASGTKLIAQIYYLLSQAQSQKLPQELIFDTILLKHFAPAEARRQLEIAIEWGRFAELFGYEVLNGTFFLDTGEQPES